MRAVLALLIVSQAVAAFAQPVEPPIGLDARLRGYTYPYAVTMLPIVSQRQSLELAYMDVTAAASANGRAVLLLHGKNFSGAYWASTIEALSNSGYRVIVPDQIGFGKSSKPENYQYSFQQLAQHTKQLIDSLGISNVSVVGHSMGGMLAVRFALMYPQAMDKLVLVNPIGLEDWKVNVPYATVDALYQQELGKKPGSVKEYMQKNYFDGTWKPEYDPLTEIQVGWMSGADYDRIAWTSALTSDMVFTQPVVYDLPSINSPALLIIGQRDRTAIGKDRAAPEIAERLGDYPELGRNAARAIPGATLVELEGVGHVPQFEAFDRYIAALTDFLER